MYKTIIICEKTSVGLLVENRGNNALVAIIIQMNIQEGGLVFFPLHSKLDIGSSKQ